MNPRRLYYFILILCCWLAIPVHAQPAPTLWQASKGDQQLLLLGSIHAANDDFYPLPAAIYEQLADADALVEEVAPAQLKPQVLQHALQQYGLLEQPQPLNQRVSDALAARIMRSAQRYHINVANWPNLRNWLINLQLTQGAIHAQGLDGKQGIDMHLAHYAQQHHIKIVGLETADEQFSILAQMDEIPAAKLYESTLAELKTAASYTQAMTKAWVKGDQQALARLYRDYLTGADNEMIRKELLAKRNTNWVHKIPSLPYPKMFVVVGDMHLNGPHSLLDKLRKQGYSISRFRYE